MYVPPASAFAQTAGSPAAATAGPGGGDATPFRTLLSEMNPLQYLPVVGPLYRAATNDTIPEPVRCFGSLLVGGLVGGPIGVATGIAALVAERVSGLDPDALGRHLLADIGIGAASPAATPGPPPLTATAAAAHAAAPASAGATAAHVALFGPAPTGAFRMAPTPPRVPAADDLAATGPAATGPATTFPAVALTVAAKAPPTAAAWSPAQLAAYGVTADALGTLHRGAVSGADVLNDLELLRTRTAGGAGRHGAAITAAS